MPKYCYKGFEIWYDIATTKDNLFQANGYVLFSGNKGQADPPQKFHTEHYQKEEAESEIKQLIKNYIDFEWREFLK